MNPSEAKETYSHFHSKDFRPGQLDAIRFISKSSKPVVVICAPTGSGKSLIGMIAGEIYRCHDGQFAYCASSKQLQTQLEHEFPEAMVIQGRANFPCGRYTHLTADQCTHSQKSPCPVKSTSRAELIEIRLSLRAMTVGSLTNSDDLK